MHGLFQEHGQTTDQSVKSPIEAKRTNVDGVDRCGCKNGLPWNAVVLLKTRYTHFQINLKLADLLVYRTVFSCSKVPDEGARRAKFADGFPASRK